MQQAVPDRRSMRLRGHDYSTPGAYLITACTHERLLLFGRVNDCKMEANRLGTIVEDSWSELPNHYGNVSLDAFVLMPNHVHGVIVIEDESTVVAAGFKPAFTAAEATRQHAVPEIVRAFKTFSARKINAMRATPGKQVWQRGFYDHVIRGERELDRVRAYITDNPRKWSEDPDNPENWRNRRRV